MPTCEAERLRKGTLKSGPLRNAHLWSLSDVSTGSSLFEMETLWWDMNVSIASCHSAPLEGPVTVDSSQSSAECSCVLSLPPKGREAERVAVKRGELACCRRRPRRSLVMLNTWLDPSVAPWVKMSDPR